MGRPCQAISARRPVPGGRVDRADRRRFRLRTGLVLAVLVPAGLGTKFYSGPLESWVHGSLGGVLYVVFWCLVVGVLLPRVRPGRIAWAVFGVTCLLEAAQLWHPPFLQAIRGTFPGALLLGTTFVPSDFPHYAAGALIGWRAVRRLRGETV